MRLSRRSFLAIPAAIPFSQWIVRAEGAEKLFTRYDARSPQGKAMLQSYATAVEKMNSTAESSPLSWLFQWYTHSVRDDRTKDSEVARVYPSPGPDQSLAKEMWETCQAHDGGDEDMFLPWHRMFVFYFERIIRKYSGNADFALPYWNYTVSGQDHGVIPVEFRQGTLSKSNRNPGVNGGQPITGNRPDLLNLDAMKEPAYQSSGRVVQGFCQNLDFGLHGNVHVYTGNTQNMGAVPWAAGDPVFWIHHCNIDRIWASWNRNGGINPTDQPHYMSQQFIFADENGARVVATVKDFVDIGKRGYTYDSFEPAPPGFKPASVRTHLTSTKLPATELLSNTSVALGNGPTRVSLKVTSAAPPSFRTRIQSLDKSKRLYLVAENFSAASAPGAVFDVYFNLPAGVSGKEADPYRVGTINFFDAVGHAGHAKAPNGKFWSTDVTDLAKRLTSRDTAGDTPTVTLAPDGRPAESAKPVVGSIRLVER